MCEAAAFGTLLGRCPLKRRLPLPLPRPPRPPPPSPAHARLQLVELTGFPPADRAAITAVHSDK